MLPAMSIWQPEAISHSKQGSRENFFAWLQVPSFLPRARRFAEHFFSRCHRQRGNRITTVPSKLLLCSPERAFFSTISSATEHTFGVSVSQC